MKMYTNTVIFWLFFAIATLFNINKVASLEIPRPQSRVLFSDPANDINNLLTTLTKQLRLSENEQLSEVATYVLFNNEKEKIAEVDAKLTETEDVTVKLNLVNNATGTNIFIISDGKVSLNAQALYSLLMSATRNFFTSQCPNLSKRQAAISEVEQQLMRNTAEVETLLEPVPLSEIKEALSVHPRRSKRAITDVLNNVFKAIIRIIIVPVRTFVDVFFENFVTVITSLYIGDQQTNPILATTAKLANQIIMEIAKIIVQIQQRIDNFLNSFLPVGASLQKRDISSSELFYRELQLDDAEASFSNEQHDRSKRNVITAGIGVLFQAILKLFSPILILLNGAAKSVFVTYLKTQYAPLGSLILTPVRMLFEIVVNTIFPCATCPSII